MILFLYLNSPPESNTIINRIKEADQQPNFFLGSTLKPISA